MSQKITIEPVTRIEGHAKITIHVDESGEVTDTRFNVVEFRGFEKFCEGRHFSEMPTLTERICGICPVSHHLASVKATDALVGAMPPPRAVLLRRLMHMGQVVQSHALSFFHLSSPDLLLGFDEAPAVRNVMGLIAKHPEIAVKAVRLRKFGQEIIAKVSGRKIHPDVCVPGGMNKGLTAQDRDEILAGAAEAMATAQLGLAMLKDYVAANREFVDTFANLDTGYMGLVTHDGELELYDGNLRLRGSEGNLIFDQHPCRDYLSVIAETTEDWSYLKFPYYRPLGYPAGAYRVGPLARLNVADRIDTPLANEELRQYRAMNGGGPNGGTMYYHVARLIELIHGIEKTQQLLDEPDLMKGDLVNPSSQLVPQGVGIIEAPRGTLIHHYQIDDKGKLERVNLIVSTGHNNLAMNLSVQDIARKYVKADRLEEGMLNRVEAAIRCYDPCLSCATHALGQMPLEVSLVGARGELLDRVVRQ